MFVSQLSVFATVHGWHENIDDLWQLRHLNLFFYDDDDDDLYQRYIYHDSIMIFSSKNIMTFLIFLIFLKYQPLLHDTKALTGQATLNSGQ